jgi:hypothetical protein
MRAPAALLAAAAYSAAAAPPLVVDLTNETLATVFAAQVCAGLTNRDDRAGPGVFTRMHPEDDTWLAVLAPDAAPAVSAAAFITACLASGAVKGRLRYDFASQQELVPNVATLAAVLDAVPLEDGSPFVPAAGPLLYDAVAAWAGYRAVNATALVFASFANATASLAKMNPGWDVHDAPLGPWTLKYQPDLSLVDHIVKERLFNFFLLEGCLPGTAEHALMEAMSTSGAWPRPIAVWGYDDTLPIAGDVFEAETTCVSAHNMGQIATVGVNNLAYFSRAPPVTAPLARAARDAAAPPRVVFNASKTYVALVVGDGDNVAFVKSSRWTWLAQRIAACRAAPPGGCFPLLWTLSPHLARFAPDMLRAFHNQTLVTGADAFILPPSGHLYAYPGLMGAADQAAFVAATEADAAIFNTSGSVEWEFVGTWAQAISGYLPRYAAARKVTYFVAVNVPYLLPIAEFADGEFFKVLNGSVVLFRPNEWRGTSGGADPLQPFLPDAKTMAARLNGYPRGTVTAIYLTSDGGGKVQDFFDLAAGLGEHVQLVGDEVGALALAAAAAAAAGAAGAGA